MRNDADITDSPAVVVTGTNITLRNAGFLNGPETGKIVQFLGAGTRFINEAAGNVGSDVFRSAIVGSQYADTIINDGNIRGRVDLGAGDDTLNLSGDGLKLNPVVREFEVLNVSSTLADLNSVSGFRTIALAPGGS